MPYVWAISSTIHAMCMGSFQTFQLTRILQPSPAHPHNKPDHLQFGSLRARGFLLCVTHVNVRSIAQKSPTIRFLPRFLRQANAPGWNVKVNIER